MLLGVIGWGLDDPDRANHSIAGIHQCLRADGVFINGWDDVPEHRPFEMDSLEALKGFKPWTFPPLETPRFLCEEQDLRHTFDFYLAEKASS